MWRSRLFYLIGCWILLLSATQAVPFVIAASLSEIHAASGFLASIMVMSVIGGSLFLGFRSTPQIKVTRLTILLPVVGGISLAIVAGMPFFFIFPDQGLVPAFFEGMSLITTTGSSAYEGAHETIVSVAFWRVQASWIGGFLAICMTLSILTAINSGGVQLHRSPLPYGDSETGYPRLRAVAISVAPIYALFTIVCCTFLMLTGMPLFEALQLAMSTISTTGIGPDGSNKIENVGTQAVLAVFMVLAMLNWDIMRARLLRVKAKHPQGLESKSVLLVLAGGALALFFLAFPGDLIGFWHSLFAAISAMSTTGFAPSEMGFTGAGADAGAIILILLACLGGAVASTTGGIKQLRVIVVYFLTRKEVDRLAHPHGVKSLRFQSFAIERRDIEAVWLLVGAFVLMLVFGTLFLAVLGIDFQAATAMSVSALTLSGPLITMIDPYFSGFSGLTEADYMILSSLMLLGRIEASLFLALLTRSFWRG